MQLEYTDSLQEVTTVQLEYTDSLQTPADNLAAGVFIVITSVLKN